MKIETTQKKVDEMKNAIKKIADRMTNIAVISLTNSTSTGTDSLFLNRANKSSN